MSNESNHIIYTIKDIQLYLSGKMTATEMHAMEKAALNDPLLADALDGYAGLPDPTNEDTFNNLKKQLDELREKTGHKVVSIKKYNYKWWRAIAAILLLGGAAFALYSILEPDKKLQPAVIAKQENIIKPHMATNDTEKGTITTVPANTQIETTEKRNDQPALIASADTKNGNNSSKRIETLKNDEAYSIANESTMVSSAPSANEDEVTAFATKKEKPAASAARRSSNLGKAFSGNVLDNNTNDAIPFAKLVINGQLQTKTDKNGYFNVTLPDSMITVDIDAKNYYSKKMVTINPGHGQIIKLIAKKTTLKKGNTDEKLFRYAQIEILSAKAAEPKEGWVKYKAFLINELSSSIYDDGSPVRGETILSFRIDNSEEPATFEFEKSIDNDVNEAIEELILTGPEWKNTDNKTETGFVRLKIIF